MSISVTFSADSVEELKEVVGNYCKTNGISIVEAKETKQLKLPNQISVLLNYSVKANVWRQFELSNTLNAKQIPYVEIVKVLNHMDKSKIYTITEVRNYFKNNEYTTATKNRVGVDELITHFKDENYV